MIHFQSVKNTSIVQNQKTLHRKQESKNKPTFKHSSEEKKANYIKDAAFLVGIGAILVYGIKNKNYLKNQGKLLVKNIKNFFRHNPKKNKTFPPGVYSLGNERELLTKKLENYFKTLQNGEEINPKELDKILTNIVGENNVQEKTFIPNFIKGVTAGRKKTYRLRNGRVITLETHTSRKGVVTRVYDSKYRGSFIEKINRSYLHPDGIFRENSYFSSDAHMFSGQYGLNWINKVA